MEGPRLQHAGPRGRDKGLQQAAVTHRVHGDVLHHARNGASYHVLRGQQGQQTLFAVNQKLNASEETHGGALERQEEVFVCPHMCHVWATSTSRVGCRSDACDSCVVWSQEAFSQRDTM